MIYAGNAASALGSLLRKAQEDRQQGPHLTPQSAQEESPIRQQIQGPIASPESMGSEKTVSLKGEMQPIQEGYSTPTGIDGTAGPGVVPPVVAPVSDTMAPAGASPMGASPMNIASSIGASGIGSALLPSSMKPGVSKAAPSVLGKSTVAATPAVTSKYGNIPTGTLTQGQPILNKTQSIASKIPGYLARGAAAVSRAALSLPMLMSGDVLKKAVESARNLGRGKTVKG